MNGRRGGLLQVGRGKRIQHPRGGKGAVEGTGHLVLVVLFKRGKATSVSHAVCFQEGEFQGNQLCDDAVDRPVAPFSVL